MVTCRVKGYHSMQWEVQHMAKFSHCWMPNTRMGSSCNDWTLASLCIAAFVLYLNIGLSLPSSNVLGYQGGLQSPVVHWTKKYKFQGINASLETLSIEYLYITDITNRLQSIQWPLIWWNKQKCSQYNFTWIIMSWDHNKLIASLLTLS